MTVTSPDTPPSPLPPPAENLETQNVNKKEESIQSSCRQKRAPVLFDSILLFTYQKQLKGSKNLPSLFSDSCDVIPQKPGRWRSLSIQFNKWSNYTTAHELVLTLGSKTKQNTDMSEFRMIYFSIRRGITVEMWK